MNMDNRVVKIWGGGQGWVEGDKGDICNTVNKIKKSIWMPIVLFYSFSVLVKFFKLKIRWDGGAMMFDLLSCWG